MNVRQISADANLNQLKEIIWLDNLQSQISLAWTLNFIWHYLNTQSMPQSKLASFLGTKYSQ